jgi:acyl carrier protein
MKTIDIADRNLAARVIKIIASQDDELDEKEVVPEATLKSLGFDSFGMVTLMFALEDEFRVEITDEMLGGIRTVGDIIAGLYRLRGMVEATS